MTIEKLAVRAAIKKRKPTFTRRHAIRQFSKLKKSGWRAPKGMGNKQRRGRKGQPITPTCGFGSPKDVKGTNKDGFFEILVSNIKDLDKITSKNQIAEIGSKVGGKKKLEILAAAKTKNLKISNVKDIDKEISKLTKVKKEVKKTSEKSQPQPTKADKSRQKSATADTKKANVKEGAKK